MVEGMGRMHKAEKLQKTKEKHHGENQPIIFSNVFSHRHYSTIPRSRFCNECSNLTFSTHNPYHLPGFFFPTNR